MAFGTLRVYGCDYGSAKKSHVPWSNQGPGQHFSSLCDLSKWVSAEDIQPAGVVNPSSTPPMSGYISSPSLALVAKGTNKHMNQVTPVHLN